MDSKVKDDLDTAGALFRQGINGQTFPILADSIDAARKELFGERVDVEAVKPKATTKKKAPVTRPPEIEKVTNTK